MPTPENGHADEQDKLLKYLRRVTSDLADTRLLLHQEQAANREPIAIVAAGCRYPGGVSSPQELWELVVDGRDAITAIPGDRGWDPAAMDSDIGHGGFLASPLTFDAAFFGVSPREALGMDPQQRLLLEVAWETVERARIDPVTLRGSRTGVFVGTFDNGYSELACAAAADVGGYILTGCTTSVASGRVAYVLGLEGPAITVNTACSSSLVAIHLAVQSLRQGDCDAALAGGATVMSTPLPFAEFSRQGVLAEDGRCRAFADGAAGIGLAEGAGLLLLERITDARRNGHPVLAVVRGSAVNSDGASNGLTAPNGPSQQRVIRQALTNAGLTADEVDLVEGHGTGTKLGDPVEVQALLATYGRGRQPDRPLWLGSVKSNIGHTQAAAGAAGVIKVLGALRHELLPPTRYASDPSPLVDWAASGLALVTEPTPWPARSGGPRRAAVSSFGISGTNAHLILEAPEPAPAANAEGEEAAPAAGAGGEQAETNQAAVVWPLSGRDDAALRTQAERLAGYLAANPGIAAADVGYALATSRAARAHRAVILGANREEMVKGLGAVARGRVTRTVVKSSGPTVAPGQVAFVFSGQGGQWAGMAVELMDGSRIFRNRLESCAEAIAPYIDWSVIDVLKGASDAPPLEQPPVIQTALFAMMISLAELWRAHGVEPAAVVGHSQGEIAAACVAGALTLDEAARIVSQRSQVAMDMAGQGGLVALNLSEGQARDLVAPWGDALSIGVINSPRSVVVAGAHAALDELLARCAGGDVRARRVPAAYASHSPQMEALRDRLHEVLGTVVAGPAGIPFYSTVTGDVLDGSRLDAAYWFRNQREPVRFEAATRRLLDAGYRTFIEVSPHPLLIASIEETVEARGAGGAIAVGTLRRDDGGPRRLRRSMAEAFVRGADISWAWQPGRKIDLPVTAFLGERYWPEATSGQGTVAGPGGDNAESEFWAAVDTGDLARVTEAIDAQGEMSPEQLVASLGDWHRRRSITSAIDQWRYQVSWSPRPADPAAGALAGPWLVAVPAGSAGADIAKAVTAMFASYGCDVRRLPVTAGEVTAEAVAAALAGIDPAGVFSLLGLDESALPEHGHVAAGLAGTNALLRTLGELAISAPLWSATRGAVSVSRSDRLTSPAQAAVWGLGRVAALEHPDRWGGLIDLPETFDDETAARLALVLTDSAGEDQLALRPPGVFARRLRRARAGAPAAAGKWCPRGTVLITGGTGALGGHVARRLASNGVAHLVLASRSGEAAPGAAELATELRSLGARTSVVACDAADLDALRSLISSLAAEGSQVRTVIHVAATAPLAPLADATSDDLADAMAGKVAGARNLDELLGEDLDDFVLFSSGSGVWGAGGQGAYAAANAALDALAEHRRARGLPATSVAWGLWEGEGMARGDIGVQLRRRGMGPMAPAYAVTALTGAVTAGEGNVVVADIRWEPFLTGFTSARATRLFDDIPEASQAAAAMAAITSAPDGTLGAQFRSAGPAELRSLLDDLIATNVAAVLNLPDASALSSGRAFRDLGFDSLTAVEMRNRLVAATGLALPTTVVFDYPTQGALAAHLRAELDGSPVRAAARSAVPPAARATDAAPPDDPIAIVGIACRFPGGADSPEELWRLVDGGVDAIGSFPADRGWDVDAVAGHCVPQGGFLYGAADFDAGFFGLSPREAIAMDPQQRLVLETSWEALERAAIDPRSLRGSRAAVVIGLVSHDYSEILRDATEADGYRITGGTGAVVSGRVAYFLGLEGQALTVDTACSSSLVAIHLASQILRRGEATLALAGGVTVMATPTPFLEFSKQQGLSSDGRCHSFAASADGTGWGEGAGVLVLQRLSEARRQRRDVLAVIRGSALNQDGASNGLTAPSGPAQQDVIRQALAAAGLAAADIDAVEAHGTATTLGDPIEARAIIATYGRDRDNASPLWLGSLKSNIGHTQGAAGVGGVIKMVQALRHEKLPVTLHVDAPTPHVDWSGGTVRLLTEPVAWPRNGRPRRAAVSAFGISGTNAHLILEEGPLPAPPSRPAAPARSVVIPLPVSGNSRPALVAQATRLARHLESAPGLTVGDVAHSLFTTRAQLTERSVVLARDRTGLLEALRALGEDGQPASVVTGIARDRPKVALLLPGQGSQRIGLGQGLRAAFPGYAAAFDAVCAELDRHLDRPLSAVLFAADGSPEAALLDRTSYAQPALFATEVAIGRLLEEFGVHPDVLLGHSIGEVAAAHLASALSLEESCALVAARGRIMQAQPAGGAMVAIEASEEELRMALAGRERQVSLAAVNGPAAVVISGDTDAVLELAAGWKARGRRIKRLNVSHAFHSPHMEGVLAELGRVVEGLTWSAPEIQIISNVTGEPLTAGELSTPEYWAQQARQTVRFGDGVRWLAQHGVTVAIELGGEGTLSGLVREGFGARLSGADPLGSSLVAIPALRTPRPEAEAFTTALSRLHVHGAAVNLTALLAALGCPAPAEAVPLPTTVFQRQRYWLDHRPARPGAGAPAARGLDAVAHPVLSAAVPVADGGGWIFAGRLSRHDQPWLADHAIEGTAVVPGSALLELALRAGRQIGYQRVAELAFLAPVRLPDDGGVDVQIRVAAPDEREECQVTIYTRPGGGSRWEPNAGGRLTTARSRDDQVDLRAWPPSGAQAVPSDELYLRLARHGFTFGPAYRSLRAAWRRDEEWFTEVRLPVECQPDTRRFEIHPALLDSAGHPALEIISVTEAARPGDVPVLFAVEDVQVDRPGAATLRARITLPEPDTIEMVLADGSGEPVARVGGLAFRPATAGGPGSVPGSASLPRDALFALRWSPLPTRGGQADGPDRRATVGQVHLAGGAAGVHQDLAALAAAESPPEIVLARITASEPDEAAGPAQAASAIRRAVSQALALIRAFLAEPRLARARLALVTGGAVTTGAGDRVRDVPGAAVWGLVRVAQNEHPDRFVVADIDQDPASWRALPAAVRGGEQQLALRAGVPWIPRLTPVQLSSVQAPPELNPAGTVLITGAGGALGGHVARHLVTRRGVRNLLLLSRTGRDDPGLADLAAELEQAGALVTVAACDVADRAALAGVLAAIAPQRPLTGIFHAAGVLSDGLLTSLTDEQVGEVLAPKADGALNLLDLTRQAALAEVVLFSSAASIVGSVGQGNYACANAVLDALAEQSRARGVPARSLAWGPWADAGGMSGRLAPEAAARLRRLHVLPLSVPDALALLDATAGADSAVTVPMRVDLAALASDQSAGLAALRGLAPAEPPDPAATTGRPMSLGGRLARLDEESRGQAVLDVVRANVARVLGHGDAQAVDPGRPFLDLGFNSLMAVELRDELSALVGRQLPATLIFEFPTPVALARHLLAELAIGRKSEPSCPPAVSAPDNHQSPVAGDAAPDGERERPILALEPI